MKPLILQSSLTSEWYVVTRYTIQKNGLLLAQRKYDVTAQIETIIHNAMMARRNKRSKKSQPTGQNLTPRSQANE